MGRKPNHLMERVYAHLSKNGCQKSGFLADPDLTGTVLNYIDFDNGFFVFLTSDIMVGMGLPDVDTPILTTDFCI
jgi:hypothetical protein